MRSTQYIGLTNRALDFLGFCTRVESDNHTTGMFNEAVLLGEWEFMGIRIKEVLQRAPWSSGPMIFTQLEFDHGDRKDRPEKFAWKEDSTGLEGEFDRELGQFWV